MLNADVAVLRDALSRSTDSVSVSLELPRASAEKVLALLDAERTTGAVVIAAKEEFTTSEAATMLGISRPMLMKFIQAGDIKFTKVGTHHRIPARAIVEFQEQRRTRQEEAMVALAEFSNKIGFVD